MEKCSVESTVAVLAALTACSKEVCNGRHLQMTYQTACAHHVMVLTDNFVGLLSAVSPITDAKNAVSSEFSLV